MAIEYRWVGGESGEYVPVEVPDPVIPVAQGIAGVLPAANQAQVADTAVNPNIGVMNDTGGLATLAQQQIQNAGAQTVAQPAAIDPEIKNFLDYQMAQAPGFLSPAIGYNTVAEYYKTKNIDPYSADMQKFAQEQIDRAKGNAAAWAAGDPAVVSAGPRPSYENLAPWANPNWQTETALRRAAEDAMREQAYYNDLKMGASIGPGPAPGSTAAPTRDPILAGILGNLDPVTALRAANIMRQGSSYYGQAPGDPQAAALAAAMKGKTLPKATLEKLFPSYASPASAPATAATTPAPTAPPAPTKTASGVTIKDYQGNQFDTGITLNLAKQIGSAFDPKKSSGAAFTTQGQSIGFDYDQAKQMLGGKDPSAAQQVLLDISRSLQQKGINDLSQIGVRTVDVEQEGYNGTRIEKQREFYNKETGERIAGENESIGQTFTGQGATYYNLDVGPDGKPTFTTKAASTSDADIAAMALPLLLGPAGLNLTGLLSGALGSAGITGLAGQAIAQGLMSGATSSLFGGDFLKGALSGAISPVVSAGIGSVLPTGFAAENPAIAKFLTNTGTSAVQGALSGKNVDFGQMLQNAALSSAIGAAMDRAGIPANLAPLLVSLARSGTITPQAAMQMITQMGRKG